MRTRGLGLRAKGAVVVAGVALFVVALGAPEAVAKHTGAPVLRASKHSTAPGREVVFRGVLPASKPRTAQLQVRSGSRWKAVRSMSTAADGSFALVGMSPNLVGQVRTFRVVGRRTPSRAAVTSTLARVRAVNPLRLVPPSGSPDSWQMDPAGRDVLSNHVGAWRLYDRATKNVTSVAHPYNESAAGASSDDTDSYFDWSTKTFTTVTFGAFASERDSDSTLYTDTDIKDASPNGRYVVGNTTLYRYDPAEWAGSPIRDAVSIWDRATGTARQVLVGQDYDSPSAETTDFLRVKGISDDGAYMLVIEDRVSLSETDGSSTNQLLRVRTSDGAVEAVTPVISYDALTAAYPPITQADLSGNGSAAVYSVEKTTGFDQAGIYREDLTSGTPTRLSAQAPPFTPVAISDDGSKVAYWTPNGTSLRGDIAWLKDVITGARHQMTRGLDGKVPNAGTGSALSMDLAGHHVALTTSATNLVPETKRMSKNQERLFLYTD